MTGAKRKPTYVSHTVLIWHFNIGKYQFRVENKNKKGLMSCINMWVCLVMGNWTCPVFLSKVND